jgi:hypothetical protein
MLFIISIVCAIWRISLFGSGSVILFVHLISLAAISVSVVIVYIIWVWLKLQPIIIRNQPIKDCLLLNILL